jgi:serine/threonine protein kinase
MDNSMSPKNQNSVTKIGEGAYGIVYRGHFMGATGGTQVIKRNLIDKSISFAGSIRELDILMAMREHPNIVQIKAVMFGHPDSKGLLSPLIKDRFKDDTMHFIFENAPIDLLQLMYAENLGYREIRSFIFDIAVGLEYLHASGYLHRDIKTQNLLVFPPDSIIPRRHVKICDFGLSKPQCFSGKLTPCIVTGWYRSPDLCMGSNRYSYEIDSWSLACVMYELFTKRAICQEYTDDNGLLLSRFFSVIPAESFGPTPSRYEIPDTIADRGVPKKNFIQSLELSHQFDTECGRGSTEALYQLFVGLFKVSPKDRFQMPQIVAHKFFDQVRINIDYRRKFLDSIPDIKQTQVTVVDCPERKWITSVVFMIYNDRDSFDWYKPRILFQSMSLFDRYLSWKKDNHQEKKGVDGMFHSQYSAILRYLVCLYMSTKYFTSIEVVISFDTFVMEEYKTEEAISFAGKFERSLIEEILKYKIYHPTVLEAISETNDVTEDEICNLLKKYGEITAFNGKMGELIEIYK